MVALLGAVVLATGCFASPIGNRCTAGHVMADGVCVAATFDANPPGGDPGPDGGVAIGADAATAVDAATGGCGANPCAGHVVLIGHDYQTRSDDAVHVLGNALALGTGSPLRVGIWRGTAGASHQQAALDAIDAAAAMVGRTWEPVEIATLSGDPDVSVLVLLPQDGDAASARAAGQAWATAARAFVSEGKTIIGLGGEGTETHEVLAGTGLLVAAAAAPATGDALSVVAPSDSLARGVATPYFADTSTLAYRASGGVIVVATAAEDGAVIEVQPDVIRTLR